MTDSEKLKVIEDVLKEFVGDKSGLATEIILQIQGKTGDETFVCNPVDLYFDPAPIYA